MTQPNTHEAFGIAAPAPIITEIRPLHVIADEIVREWKQPYFGAVPYIEAMRYLNKITDKYGYDSAERIVAYFLSNAKTWKGETARRIKAELRSMLK